jgi:hypothetical protein
MSQAQLFNPEALFLKMIPCLEYCSLAIPSGLLGSNNIDFGRRVVNGLSKSHLMHQNSINVWLKGMKTRRSQSLADVG